MQNELKSEVRKALFDAHRASVERVDGIPTSMGEEVVDSMPADVRYQWEMVKLYTLEASSKTAVEQPVPQAKLDTLRYHAGKLAEIAAHRTQSTAALQSKLDMAREALREIRVFDPLHGTSGIATDAIAAIGDE